MVAPSLGGKTGRSIGRDAVTNRILLADERTFGVCLGWKLRGSCHAPNPFKSSKSAAQYSYALYSSHRATAKLSPPCWRTHDHTVVWIASLSKIVRTVRANISA